MLPILFFLLDQIVKYFVRATLAVGASWFSFGPFGITHFENTSGPFSLPIPFFVLTITHALVLSGIGFAFWKLPHQRRGLLWILAGGLSNLIDRVILASTTDFIALPFHGYWNIADVSVLIGILILFFTKPTSPHREA